MRKRRVPLEQVAQFVRDWPGLKGYGPALAEKHGVPLRTAQDWVYLARLQGLLPPGDAPRPCRLCGGTGEQRRGG